MKSRILFFSFIAIVILYIISMFVQIGDIKLNSIWFSVAMLCVGIYALIYSYLYKLDSELYYGVLNIMFAMATAYRFITDIKFMMFYPIYILCFAVAHLAVFVLFRQKIHFKLFAILFLECILLTSYKMNFLSLYVLLAINIIFLLFVAINGVYRLRKNLRRE